MRQGSRENRNPEGWHPGGGSGGEEDQRLAFLLDTAESGDAQALRALMDRHIRAAMRLACILLEGEPGGPPSERDLFECARRALATAAAHLAEFRGQESVLAWLLSYVFNACTTLRRRRKVRRMLSHLPLANRLTASPPDPPCPWVGGAAPIWPEVRALPEGQRATLALYFTFGLSVRDLSEVLRASTARAWRRLARGLDTLLQGRTAHREVRSQRTHHRAIRKGLLAGHVGGGPSPARRPPLIEHLQECDACTAYDRAAAELVSELRSTLPGHLADLQVPDDVRARLESEVIARLASAQNAAPLTLRLRQLAGLGIAALVLGFGLLMSMRMAGGDNGTSPPPALAPAPTPISERAQESITVAPEPERTIIENPIVHSQPSISGGGSLIAFSSTDSSLAPGITGNDTQVYVLNVERGSIALVSVTASGEPASAWSAWPRLAADGSQVVFASQADDLSSEGAQGCLPSGGCANIYVRNLNLGTTRLVSAPLDGVRSNGGSWLPEISANGRWITFWSEATNLVSGGGSPCDDRPEGSRCANLYLYDHQADRLCLIPIGRDISQETVTERTTISADGRVLAVTLNRSDAVAERMGMPNPYDVFVYHVDSGTFESVNVSNVGIPGDRPSLHGAISASGEYVAYASRASNLAETDLQGGANVFLHRISDGSTSLVSAGSSEGAAGSRGSEAMGEVPRGWLPQIDLSAEGRTVLFSSAAPGLTWDSPGCPFPTVVGCNAVYLREVAPGHTALLSPARVGGSFFGDIDLSEDGGWAVLQEFLFSCGPEEACSELWLIDTRTGESTGLLREPRPGAGASGKLAPSLTLQAAGSVGALAFSPDAIRLVAGGGDGVIRVWALPSGDILRTLEGHRLPVVGLALGHQGDLLFSASRDRSLRAWSMAEGTPRYLTREEFGDLAGLSASPQGDILAAGGSSRVWIWRLEDRAPSLIRTLKMRQGAVTSVALAAEGGLVAVGSTDGSVWIYRLADGRLLLRVGDQRDKILDLAFSPDEAFLAYGSADGSLDVWGLSGSANEGIRAAHLLSAQHTNWVNALTFLPGRRAVAYSILGDKVYVRRIPAGETLLELAAPGGVVLSSVRASQDGRFMAAGSVGGDVFVWDLVDSGGP